MRALRATCDPSLGARLAKHVLADLRLEPGAVAAGFWPLPDEIDIRPLLEALSARGHPIALPKTPPRGSALTFHRWRPGDTLIAGRFGTVHPEGEALVPNVFFVPLLAFDRTGHRLGYGAGYYDRTLLQLPPHRTIGCAFAVQEIACVPAEPHDRPLDAVATENGVIVTR